MSIAILENPRLTLKVLLRNPASAFGLIIITLFIVWSIIEGSLQVVGTLTRHPSLGWVLLPYNPLAVNLMASNEPPSIHHLLGTNAEGQDILSRILYAAPIDASVSIVTVFSAIAIGGVLGMIAGYYGGWIDEVIGRVTDAFLSIPGLILLLALTILIGSGYFQSMIALIIVWWPIYARLSRAQTLEIKSRYFIDSARLSGLGDFLILIKHVFPNMIDPVLAYATLDFGNVILTYATLGFLGIGIKPPTPEWGEMVSAGLEELPGYWWTAIFPGLVITIVALSFALVGDGLQDILVGRINY
ncbi:MAG: ABC transporter permease [Caldivirga sp.]